MAENLDELFGGAGRPRPRTRRVATLLVAGLILSVLGLGCTVVPGVAVLLAAWSAADGERERIESGYLTEEDRPLVTNLRRWTTAALFAATLLLFLQLVLLQRGFYNGIWDTALRWLLTTV